jgi:small-conductance mechanosensitive channel
LLLVALVVATAIIGDKHDNTFVSDNQRYILSLEIVVLVVFLVEMLGRIITNRPNHSGLTDLSSNWRLIVRIVGYTLGALFVISILASSNTLGISVGAIAGVVIAFATQNIASSVLAAILNVSTRMIRVGEQITINNTKGTVSDIGLTHTVLSVDDDVVFVPNSLIVANLVRRQKRNGGINSVNDW